jgi:Leucine-rich repeat (LRR) protein
VRVLQRRTNETDCLRTLEKLRTSEILSFTNERISDLKAFEHMIWLRGLEISRSQISDASPLSTLTAVEKLFLYENNIESIEFVRSLPVKVLKLEKNQISDIQPLLNHPTLEELALSHNTAIHNVSPLGSVRLTKLWMNSVPIGDHLSSMFPQPRLTLVELSATQLTDLAPLGLPEAAPSLTKLFLRHNMIADVEALAGLTTLEGLDLAHNPIDDLSSLQSLSGLTGLDVSYVHARNLAEIIPHLQLTQLRAAGLEISNLEWTAHLSQNTFVLDLSDNRISDVSPLYRLENLSELKLGANPIQTIDIDWLHSLQKLHVFEIDTRSIASPELRRQINDFKMLVFERHRRVIAGGN